MIKLPPLTTQSSVKEALGIFIDNPALDILPVVRPGSLEYVGLVSYLDVLRLLSSCQDGAACKYDLLTSIKPMPTFDLTKPLDDNRNMIVESMKAEEGIIVTDGPIYRGILPQREIARHVYEENIVVAQAQNPLTGLPGNVSIRRKYHEIIAAGVPVRFCYCDINNFKPFNDHRGTPAGDDVIKFTASVLVQNARKYDGWVGHIGGDDFVILAKDDGIDDLCKGIIADFETGKRAFYDSADITRGFILGKDREGRLKTFQFIGLCVAVSNIVSEGMVYEDVGAAVAAFKAQIKEEKGGSSAYRIDRRAIRQGNGSRSTNIFGG